MLDLENEQILPLSRAHTHPLLRQGRRPGRPINRSTLERWRLRGVRGPGGQRVVLETALVGAGSRVTTAEALARFFARLNGDGGIGGLTPAQARRQHAEAEKELTESGM